MQRKNVNSFQMSYIHKLSFVLSLLIFTPLVANAQLDDIFYADNDTVDRISDWNEVSNLTIQWFDLPIGPFDEIEGYAFKNLLRATPPPSEYEEMDYEPDTPDLPDHDEDEDQPAPLAGGEYLLLMCGVVYLRKKYREKNITSKK